MHIRERINLKKYFGYSAITTGICFVFVRNIEDVYGILIVYLATITNQLMLVEGIGGLIAVNNGKTSSKQRIVLLFIGKIFLLFAGLSLSVHFMGKKVIIPLINYVVMIFILTLSSKR